MPQQIRNFLLACNRLARALALRALLLCAAVLTLPLVVAPVYAQSEGVCDRTPQVRDAILQKLPTNDCAAVTAADLAGITGELYLSGRGITALEANDFAGLAGVTLLHLSYNNLASLSNGAFNGLDNLTNLNLYSNRLVSLPSEVFAPLGSLTYLNLPSNQLASLPSNIFNPLSKLTHLVLSGNKLSSLPDDVFSTLVNLTYLDLSGNDLDSLPGILISPLVNLASLNLSKNELVSLPNAVFKPLVNLSYLYLFDNDLASLPSTLFNSLAGLVSLNLSDNELVSLPRDVFGSLGGLRYLNLSHNDLDSLPHDIFNPLSNLTSLDLSYNYLNSLPDKLFVRVDGAVDLHRLYLYGNPAPRLMPPLQIVRTDAKTDALGPANIVVSVPTGAPATLSVTISVEGGTFSIGNTFGARAYTAIIPNSSTKSAPIRVTRDTSNLDSATLKVTASWPRFLGGRVNIPRFPHYSHRSYDPSDLYRYPLAISTGSALKIFPWLQDSCGRTAQVTTKIVAALRAQRRLQPNQGCEHISAEDLATITALDLSNSGVTTLKVGDFTGLTGLTALDLRNNTLTALPDGVFVRGSNSSGLQSLSLRSNTAASITLPMHLVVHTSMYADAAAPATMAVHFPSGSPSDISVEVLADGGNISANGAAGAGTYTTTIATGATMSERFIVQRDPGTVESIVLKASKVSWANSVAYSGLNLPPGATMQALPKLEGICGRTRQVRTKIMRLLRRIYDCADVTAAHLAGITGDLWMNTEYVTTLKDGDFAGLTQLRGLHLSYNRLSALPDDVFKGLDNLSALGLSGNQLSSLPDKVFAGLSSLSELYLNNNRLTSLPDKVFADLSSLSDLHLENNRLTSLPNNVFAGLGSLTYLPLYNNRLTSLPNNVFAELGSLVYLPLENNHLTSLSGGVFAGLSDVIYLSLADNHLTSLSGHVFADLSNMFTLSLEGNFLTDLPDGVFTRRDNPADLANLGLHKNPGADFTLPLQLVRTDADADAPGPATMMLSFPAGAPATLSVTLSAQGGVFSTVDATGASIYTATIVTGETVSESFTVTRNPSVEVQAMLAVTKAALPELFYDDFGNYAPIYKGFSIPDDATIKLFPGLSGICNRTPQVRDAIMAVLRRGNVLQSAATCADVRRAHLEKIEVLNLIRRGITSLQAGDFGGLVNLDKLSISENGEGLARLPRGVFGDLEALTLLILDSNGLTELPQDVFQNLGNLTALSFQGNKIESLRRDVFAGLGELVSLRMNAHRLSALPAGIFRQLGKLNELYVHENLLASLPADVFVRDGGAELLTLDLNSNPGTPFALPMEIVRVDADAAAPGPAVMAVKLPGGAPAVLGVTLSAAGGEFSGDAGGVNTYTVTIAAGATMSSAVTLTRYENTAQPALVRVVSAPNAVASVRHFGISFFDSANPPRAEVFSNLANICARTAKVRDAILEQLRMNNCASVGVANLAAINNLNLFSEDIPALAPGDFAGLGGLAMLNLSDNPLRELPRGVFNDLTSLRDLYLYGAGLRELPEGVFARTPNLQRLDLHDNELRELSGGVFDSLGRLTKLNLSGNPLQSLADGVFAGLRSLTSLDLTENTLRELPHAMFARGRGAAPLAKVRLRPQGGGTFEMPLSIVRADADDDAAAPAKVTLHFPHGAPADISVAVSAAGGVFAGGVQKYNAVIAAGETISDAFTVARIAQSQTPAVVTVDAARLPQPARGYGNQYTGFVIGEGARISIFPNLANICSRTRQVRDAIVAALPSADNCEQVDAAKLAMVQTLNLSAQNLSALKASDFAGLTSLTELNLSGNELASLPAAVFSELASLETLQLSGNALSALSAGVFASLASLSELHLNGNALSALPGGVFARDDAAELRILDLRENAGAPFQLPLQLVRTDAKVNAAGPAKIAAGIAHGAPVALAVNLTVQGGAFANGAQTYTAAIAAGATKSDEVGITRNAGEKSPATVRITSAPLPQTISTGKTAHNGFEIAHDMELTIFPAAGLPRNVAAGNASRQLTLIWREALRDNADITGYSVRWKAASAEVFASGDSAAITVQTGDDSYAHTIENLNNGAAYDVGVAVSTAAGNGEFVSVRATPAPFRLNVIGGDEVVLRDALIISRYFLGFRGGSLVDGFTHSHDADIIQARIAAAEASRELDINADGAVNSADALWLIITHPWRITPATPAGHVAILERIRALLP